MKESYRAKVSRLAKELATLGYTIRPIEPRGALYGSRCEKCRCRVVAGTGDLIGGRFCGRCAAVEQESQQTIEDAA